VGMMQLWEGREMHIKFYKENPEERKHLKDVVVDRRIILQRILKK
jgi:hypothetical protein